MSLLLTDDETIHHLNLEYRGKDKPTDVLSFAQRDEAKGEGIGVTGPMVPRPHGPTTQRPNDPELLGDVVISVETAARQADTHGVSLDDELALLVTHGILHLLGYDDMTDEGAEKMQEKERALGVRR